MNQNSLNFLQRMVQHSRASQIEKQVKSGLRIAPLPQKAREHTTPPIWFDMQLYRGGQVVDVLDTYGSYTLILKICTEQTSFQDQLYKDGIKNLEQLKLHAQCVAGKHPIFDQGLQIDIKNIPSFQKTFTIEIPANLQTDKLDLKLYTLYPTLSQLGSSSLPVTYTNSVALPSYEYVTNQIKPDIPPEVAIINVSTHPQLDHTLAFTIRGYNVTSTLKQQTYESEVIANIPHLMHLGEDPEDPAGKYQDAVEIRGHMKSFSAEFRPLIENWLQGLQQTYKDKLTLVIIDTSRMEIPWEMIELTSSTSYEYIGTIATVTRWQPQKQTTSKNFMLNVYPQAHQGAILYYLDEHLGHYTEQEHKVIQTLESKYCSSLEILEAHLYGPLDRFGLIYVGCHGAEGRSLQKQYPTKLTANHLRVIEAHKEARPIAFINACESARVIRGDPNDNSSFVDVMLQNLVSGYIGTLAKVGLEEASMVARDFIEQVKAEDSIPIAQVLRNLRRIAARELFKLRNIPPSNEEKLAREYEFLYTFLYVYYGNPLAYLQLTPGSVLCIGDATSAQPTGDQICNN